MLRLNPADLVWMPGAKIIRAVTYIISFMIAVIITITCIITSTSTITITATITITITISISISIIVRGYDLTNLLSADALH